MHNRPDPALFARLSFYLGYASSGIIFLSLVLVLLRSSASQIMWLALITSAAGTFMAWAARTDFREAPGTEEAARMAQIGWRVNLIALSLMALLLLLTIVLRLLVVLVPTPGSV